MLHAIEKVFKESKIYNCRLESSNDLSWNLNDRGSYAGKGHKFVEMWILASVRLRSYWVNYILCESVVSQYFHLL